MGMDDPTTKRIQEIKKALTEQGYTKKQISTAFNEFVSEKSIDEMTLEAVQSILNPMSSTSSVNTFSKKNDSNNEKQSNFNELKNTANTNVMENSQNMNIMQNLINETRKQEQQALSRTESMKTTMNERISEEESKKRLLNKKKQEEARKYQEKLRIDKINKELYLQAIRNRLSANKEEVVTKEMREESTTENPEIVDEKGTCCIHLKHLNLGASKKLYRPKEFLLKDLIKELKEEFKIQTILLMKGKTNIDDLDLYKKDSEVSLEGVGFYPKTALALLE